MKSDSGSCICEYHDPSGVFPLISQQLQSRLPLRNLNWKSGDRPVRSIDSLHVDFREAEESPGSRPQSSSSAVGGRDGPTQGIASIAKERRHQIPGLRQTPYLKLYLLRCDDVETYRETSRKNLREWLKTHTPPSQKTSSSAQENHDAFEWMIVHVVLPNTVAATQPRYSKKNKDDDDEEANPKKPGKSRLKIGKSSNTILEKIKADFNVSSKSAPDRVAQVRLQSDDVPKHLLPTRSATDVDHPETAQEKSGAWQDLVIKLRNLILASFDLRVRQYEDDIRERGSQRSLPGWNFCTFFVLKEGLARGFESVGLLDDALLGYDELGVELEAIIREPGLSTVFLPFTDDLAHLLDLIRSGDRERLKKFHWHDRPISATRKPYREMILANQISIFDFRCYIFARQLEILLRMGFLYHKDDGGKTQSEVDRRQSVGSPDVEDVAVIADICRRTSLFIAATSPSLAQEISEALEVAKIRVGSTSASNVTSSWIFAVTRQVIKATQSPSLMEKIAAAERNFRSFVLAESENTSGKAAQNPQAPGAGAIRPPITSEMPPSIRSLLEGTIPVVQTVSYDKTVPEPLYELARKRSDLVMLQRQVIERLAIQRKWAVGWEASLHGVSTDSDDMKQIDLNGTEDEPREEKALNSQDIGTNFICVDALAVALTHETQCRKLYERLTRLAIHHSLASEGLHAVEKSMADLAILRYQMTDYQTSSRLLDLTIPVFDQGRWNSVVIQLLTTQAKCLRQLGRQDEYVGVLLKLLRYTTSASGSRGGSAPERLANSFAGGDIEEQLDIDHSLGVEITRQSEALSQRLELATEDYFTDIEVHPYIRQLEDQDGFQLRVRLRSAMSEPIDCQNVELHLRGSASISGQEIVLKQEQSTKMMPGLNTIVFQSQTTIFDELTVTKLVLSIGKIYFTYERFRRDRHNRMQSSKEPADSLEQPLRILSYPRLGSFQVRLEVNRNTAIDRIRLLDLTCSSGNNTLKGVQVRLKAATGGLRLRTGEAHLHDDDNLINKKSKPGIIELPAMAAGTSTKICIPYELEGNLSEITVAIDATYRTDEGSFNLLSAPTIRVALPLDVSVHDLFKESALFSKFNIRTADDVPMELLEVELQGSDAFRVENPPCKITPVTVFAKQSIPVLYKVHPSTDSDGQVIPRSASTKERPLSLRIIYRQIDEVVAEILRHSIRQALSASEIQSYGPLIEESLVKKLPDILSIEDLAQTAMLQEISLPKFAAMNWETMLRLLAPSVSRQVEPFLKNWHDKNLEVPLDTGIIADLDEKLTHTLIITVPLPRLHVLHTAFLKLPGLQSYLTTGQIQTATLTLKNTRRWESPNTIEALAKSASPGTPVSFIVEIDAPPDQWLIGGMRCFHITPSPEETLSFPVMLMPLKPGHLPLPTVDVRFADKALAEKLSCATDFVDLGVRVAVVNGVGEISVGLKEGAMGTEVVVRGVEGLKGVASG